MHTTVWLMCMVIMVIIETHANGQSHCKIFPHNWSISEIVNETTFMAHVFINVIFFLNCEKGNKHVIIFCY